MHTQLCVQCWITGAKDVYIMYTPEIPVQCVFTYAHILMMYTLLLAQVYYLHLEHCARFGSTCIAVLPISTQAVCATLRHQS